MILMVYVFIWSRNRVSVSGKWNIKHTYEIASFPSVPDTYHVYIVICTTRFHSTTTYSHTYSHTCNWTNYVLCSQILFQTPVSSPPEYILINVVEVVSHYAHEFKFITMSVSVSWANYLPHSISKILARQLEFSKPKEMRYKRNKKAY